MLIVQFKPHLNLPAFYLPSICFSKRFWSALQRNISTFTKFSLFIYRIDSIPRCGDFANEAVPLQHMYWCIREQKYNRQGRRGGKLKRAERISVAQGWIVVSLVPSELGCLLADVSLSDEVISSVLEGGWDCSLFIDSNSPFQSWLWDVVSFLVVPWLGLLHNCLSGVYPWMLVLGEVMFSSFYFLFSFIISILNGVLMLFISMCLSMAGTSECQTSSHSLSFWILLGLRCSQFSSWNYSWSVSVLWN